MSQPLKISGMVLSAMPIGEYDRRIVVLSADRGKIHGFARGARRSGSNMMAATQPFVLAEFTVYEGRDSYTFTTASVIEYFNDIREDIEAFCYGSYFLELAEYYGRENIDSYQSLTLLYLSVKALTAGRIPAGLVRSIFEMKLLVINGEYPDFFSCRDCGDRADLSVFSFSKNSMICSRDVESLKGESMSLEPAALYALRFIVSSPVKKLFSFTLSEKPQAQIRKLLDRYMAIVCDRKFKSLEILSEMGIT